MKKHRPISVLLILILKALFRPFEQALGNRRDTPAALILFLGGKLL
jgi:hypothetical protein